MDDAVIAGQARELEVVVRSVPSAVNSDMAVLLRLCVQDRMRRAIASEASRILARPSASEDWAAWMTQWLM